MDKRLKTVFQTYSAEITEKKSRFIASISPAADESEAQDFIKLKKKEFYNAAHNCSAYIIGTDGHIKHSSDDGEPSGTAGKPMLAVLESNGLYNVAAVVTRYFGGILLGTGGLVRAYSKALEECISRAELKEMFFGTQIKIEASYSDSGKLQYMFANENITVISSDYTDRVCFTVIIPSALEDAFAAKLSELTANKAVMTVIERTYYNV